MSSPYRLEVAVKRIRVDAGHEIPSDYVPLIAVRFLDFPEVFVKPPPTANFVREEGRVLAYNICHKADFFLDPVSAAGLRSCVCTCELRCTSLSGAKAAFTAAKWACPCPLEAQTSSTHRAFGKYSLRVHTEAVMGYVEMCCRVVAPLGGETMGAVDPARPLISIVPSPATQSVMANTPRMAGAAAISPHRPSVRPGDDGTSRNKPYIVRVVVNGNHKDPLTSSRSNAARTPVKHSAVPHSQPPPPPPPTKKTLLYLLQYDVAYQLQSITETLATTIKREHSTLNGTTVGEASHQLITSIERSVELISKYANIILQVANQLIEKSTIGVAGTGTTRLADGTSLRRNPVNQLPVPVEGSIEYFLMYDVLFQLQCTGTNLAYVATAYHAALDVALSTLPPHQVGYCRKLEKEALSLTKKVNILVQGTIDGRFITTAGKPLVVEAAGRTKTPSGEATTTKTASKAVVVDLSPHKPLPVKDVGNESTRSYTSFSSRSSSPSTLSSESSIYEQRRPQINATTPPVIAQAPPPPPPRAQPQPTSIPVAPPLVQPQPVVTAPATPSPPFITPTTTLPVAQVPSQVITVMPAIPVPTMTAPAAPPPPPVTAAPLAFAPAAPAPPQPTTDLSLAIAAPVAAPRAQPAPATASFQAALEAFRFGSASTPVGSAPVSPLKDARAVSNPPPPPPLSMSTSQSFVPGQPLTMPTLSFAPLMPVSSQPVLAAEIPRDNSPI